ncbi:transglutaminase domain-containing protein [Paenibacillus silvae]|uniref:transglutaminase domain-containing protein n=1 Tax=Paenibacillus silvae TaxID=1325358 RepID=UPI002002C51A|nr:transglutaminase domain-containing protein [Paenibacillus silvae]MCK6078336.1 transglutaminase domain-containing protein [Paenibacillus silvae]MCK6150532.1 transglutaminase domain-containing protein [Paenibacillus silvae]MCK6268792.1 transglutaminase domain-containing protein [Paenibacillus silvae]MCK6270385.1 transglutaminase domain-containing protein [Paenibacillus silvae]
MLQTWLDSLREFNGITILLLLIVAASLLQGWSRGASRSAGRLFGFLMDGIMAVIGILLSIGLTLWLAPYVQQWLSEHASAIPNRELSRWEQLYYTLVTAIADFPLMRFAVLFVLSYGIIRMVLGLLSSLIISRRHAEHEPGAPKGVFSRLTGAVIGTIIGSVRGMIVIAVLFMIVSLYPGSMFSRYVEASPIYMQGAKSVIEPLSGTFIKDKLPVFTQAVQKELGSILQRKYEVIDHNIPADIEQAAQEIVKGKTTDEAKAKALYDWVGTRIQYDYGKVDDYEQKGIWHEQTPQNTFDTRKGVCIDYARLYAVMARSQGLDVKVVTGLGYNGQGGYGPHAWNEVYVSDTESWIPLDPTWAISGDWFNPPNFADTHLKDQSA